MQGKNTHILVVTEKPSVARAIARVLGADERKDGYFEVLEPGENNQIQTS